LANIVAQHGFLEKGYQSAMEKSKKL